MSVILDALKKAQNDRKDLTKSLHYDTKSNPQKPRWLIYVVAFIVVCVLLVFLLTPGPRQATTTTLVATKTAQDPPPSLPAVEEQVLSITQSAVSGDSVPQPQRPAVRGTLSMEARGAAKEHDQIGSHWVKDEADKKVPYTIDPLRQSMVKGEQKVFIAPVDHEKINTVYNEALKETEKGNMKGAKRLYQTILAEQPHHIEALNNLGVIAMREGGAEEALYYFNKVLQHKKNYGKAYNNIGLIMMKDGQKKLAEEYFKKSIELGKDNIEPSLNLAALLRSEKRHEEASRLLRGLIGTSIKNKSLYLSYALIKDEMGQYEEAIQYYKAYLREGAGTDERNEVAERLKILENVLASKNR